MTITGFIFDFDGLIIDTEMPRFNAWQEIFTENGFSFTLEAYLKIIGTDTRAASYDPAQDLSERTHGRLSREEITAWEIEKSTEMIRHQPLLPGVESFIHQAYDRGIIMAIASGSVSEWVEPFLEQHNLSTYFQKILTRRDVEFIKPHPAVYQLAVQKLGISPLTTIAFEDSLNGLKAAKAAGLYSVAVPNQITRHTDLSIADKIVDSFEQLSIDDLYKLGQ
jgi:HAD superfamily hydrolase (TIGR01509 family)